jgi:hypothetical protein
VQEFETYQNGRDLLKEVGGLIRKLDPFDHPRSTHARNTSAALLEDGWMNFVVQGTADDQLGSIEHQLYPVPFVLMDNGRADRDTSRRRMWNGAMNGQYVSLPVSDARQSAAFHDFFAGTRHWELEPYFDVDGGRAVALEGVEYIIYIEKPSGPVEVLVEKHGYNGFWVNPLDGERTKLKDFKAERYTAEPPDRNHDWILQISREGHKEGMLRSYKFESRPILLQEAERTLQKIPFDIEQPAGDSLSVSKAAPFAAKVKRETHATRTLYFLWTGEVVAGAQGFRVLGTGAKGALNVPSNLAKNYPAVLNLRLYGMNAVGKVYSMDKTYQLAP